jgi:MYXO-CTERM domain-containing protein
MREGTRTVLSMQNNYQGPPDRFAMVVPVPVVLQKENVKTLARDVFDRVDQLAAPRLVEYWEQDPCNPPEPLRMVAARGPGGGGRAAAADGAKGLGVKIEAQFTVGEYDIVVLSASDSMGLDTWLRQNKYDIPDGAEAALKPYVTQGMKFFVAKVDPAKVTFKDGQAMLSPLRFHYDAETFSLPVRLGLLNSKGTQDLVVHILARDRYEVTNKKNVTIPTNLAVDEKARDQFPAMYAALFDATAEQNPGAVITEYAWAAATCDPCPTPPLTEGDFTTLGGDVIPPVKSTDPLLVPSKGPIGYTLTRLHLRYRREALADDLVFRTAPPITGGREVYKVGSQLEHGAEKGGFNNFQGRYIIRHPWTGPIACESPRRGIFGGPPGGGEPQKIQAARDLAFAPRGGVQLASLVRENVPEINLVAQARLDLPKPAPTAASPAPATSTGCGGCATSREGAARSSLLWALGALALAWRRRRLESR